MGYVQCKNPGCVSQSANNRSCFIIWGLPWSAEASCSLLGSYPGPGSFSPRLSFMQVPDAQCFALLSQEWCFRCEMVRTRWPLPWSKSCSRFFHCLESDQIDSAILLETKAKSFSHVMQCMPRKGTPAKILRGCRYSSRDVPLLSHSLHLGSSVLPFIRTMHALGMAQARPLLCANQAQRRRGGVTCFREYQCCKSSQLAQNWPWSNCQPPLQPDGSDESIPG